MFMNIMLTCAGRRNYLVHYFREALGGRGQVFAVDASAEAPALHEADRAFVVPPIDHTDYIDTLLTLCREHQIGLLVPSHDFELPLLARQRQRFLELGVIPLVSSPEIIDTCYDKWATSEFLERCDLPVLKTYLSLAEAHEALYRREISFPLVIKPRWGTTSIGIEYPADEEELDLAYRLTKKCLGRTSLAGISATDPERCVLIQERLWGQEYGLDVINDLNSHYVCTFIRRKYRMRAGQTDRAVTVHDERIERVGATVGRRLSHIGSIDCDVIVSDGKCFVIDINPRFGTGYPFSHIAGANLASALIAWANRDEPDKHWFEVQPNVLAAKYDQLLVIEGNNEQ